MQGQPFHLYIVYLLCRVNLKEFSLSGGDADCSRDKFWISTELTHGEGVRHGAQGAICGARSGAQSEYHIMFV